MIGQRVKIWLKTGFVFLILAVILIPATALGTWNIILNEYFESPAVNWPWGNWSIRNVNPSWGIQSTYYNSGFGNQAVWILGSPFQNGLDPQYDQYPSNYLSWMYWGPFSLTDAEDARVLFHLLNRSESYHDSVWWGATSTDPTVVDSYFVGGSHWGVLNSFEPEYYSLSELDSMGETISLCGRPQVWIGWMFSSDGNPITAMGAIVDDVILAWDDGMFDLRAMFMEFVDTDTASLHFDPIAGDTVLMKFQYYCAGNGETPEYTLEGTLNDVAFYSERIVSEGETHYTVYSDPWVVEPGDWTIRWNLDTLDEVVETNEDNNDMEDSIHVDEPNTPPMIAILTPPAGGATADLSYLITWVDEDPDDNALIYMFYDDDPSGYNGTILPGGNGIEEDSPGDSLRWNTTNIPEGEYWIWARIADPYTSTQTYSAGPVIIDHATSVPDAQNVTPAEFSLAPIYPNPFNATATLTFSVPFETHVRLDVFNLLGQRVAEVMAGEATTGVHRVQWSANDLPSGVYLVRLQAQDFVQTQKVVLMK